MLRKLIAVAGLAALAVAAPLSSASAKTCKGYWIEATGGGAQTWVVARAKARIAWNAETRRRLGPAWRLWMRSKDRSYNCRARRGRKVCTVLARPCRAGKAEAQMCKSKRIARTGARRQTRPAARRSARNRWSARVRAVYGGNWDSWSAARGRDVDCWRAKGRHQCKASARPCR